VSAVGKASNVLILFVVGCGFCLAEDPVELHERSGIVSPHAAAGQVDRRVDLPFTSSKIDLELVDKLKDKTADEIIDESQRIYGLEFKFTPSMSAGSKRKNPILNAARDQRMEDYKAAIDKVHEVRDCKFFCVSGKVV
jgi:hypothetical protein